MPCATRYTGLASGNESPTNYAFLVLTYKCLHGMSPGYLSRFYVPVTTVEGRPQLRSFHLIIHCSSHGHGESLLGPCFLHIRTYIMERYILRLRFVIQQ